MAMKRMSTLFILFFVLSITVASFEALAQSTPQDPAFAGIPITFGKNDILNAMTDDERKDFLEMRKKLKQLKKAKESRGVDPAVREASAIYYETTSKKFEKEFGAYRGFKGKTVTVYGFPSPTKREIFEIVLGERFAGKKISLHQHWKREDSGEVVGMDTKPTFETSPYPAGDEVRAKVKMENGKDRPRTSDKVLTADQQCRKKAGPVQSNWNYKTLGDPKCKCSDPKNDFFGIPSCSWYSDRK